MSNPHTVLPSVLGSREPGPVFYRPPTARRATLSLMTLVVMALVAGVLVGCTSHPGPLNGALSRAALPTPTPSATLPAGPVPIPVPHGRGPGGSITTTWTSAVALTFDDGPDPTYTPILLNMLETAKIHATFCLVGFRVRDHPDLVRRIVADGDTICNHTWQHRYDLSTLSDPQIRHDLGETNAAILRAAPDAKIAYFRAPGGFFDPRLVGVAASMGMESIYWAVDPRDWDFTHFGRGATMVHHILSTIESQVRPGSIILSHDLAKPDTMTAYRTLIPWLMARFTLIPLPVPVPESEPNSASQSEPLGTPSPQQSDPLADGAPPDEAPPSPDLPGDAPGTQTRLVNPNRLTYAV
jgi:peptidoglycan/xylan/chitin deacetylase (PgdA/CDA1 family)